MSVLTKMLHLPVHFPLIRGMVSYSIIWPTCSIVQEYLEHGTTLENADWSRAARFGIFGTFFMAPVFYSWMKYTSGFFPKKNLVTAITRAAIEQISYSPLAMAYFFFGMSMLEGKPYKVCLNEVREKFWDTYKIGVIFWPTAQTLNFYFISEKNRIVFVSIASFVWTVYLAHMKGMHQKNDDLILESQPSRTQSEIDKNITPTVFGVKSNSSNTKSIIGVNSNIAESDNNSVLVLESSSDHLDHRPDETSHKIEESQSLPIMTKKPGYTTGQSSSESAVDKKKT